MNPKTLVANRPAESGGVAGSLAVLIAYLAGVDDAGVITALAVVVGALPAIITKIVVLTGRGGEHGETYQPPPASGTSASGESSVEVTKPPPPPTSKKKKGGTR